MRRKKIHEYNSAYKQRRRWGWKSDLKFFNLLIMEIMGSGGRIEGLGCARGKVGGIMMEVCAL